MKKIKRIYIVPCMVYFVMKSMYLSGNSFDKLINVNNYSPLVINGFSIDKKDASVVKYKVNFEFRNFKNYPRWMLLNKSIDKKLSRSNEICLSVMTEHSLKAFKIIGQQENPSGKIIVIEFTGIKSEEFLAIKIPPNSKIRINNFFLNGPLESQNFELWEVDEFIINNSMGIELILPYNLTSEAGSLINYEESKRIELDSKNNPTLKINPSKKPPITIIHARVVKKWIFILNKYLT